MEGSLRSSPHEFHARPDDLERHLALHGGFVAPRPGRDAVSIACVADPMAARFCARPPACGGALARRTARRPGPAIYRGRDRGACCRSASRSATISTSLPKTTERREALSRASAGRRSLRAHRTRNLNDAGACACFPRRTGWSFREEPHEVCPFLRSAQHGTRMWPARKRRQWRRAVREAQAHGDMRVERSTEHPARIPRSARASASGALGNARPATAAGRRSREEIPPASPRLNCCARALRVFTC